ncbi:kisspeptin 2 isoform X2 [Poeciliopsis prolifica]|uniref:kisspeptin 2 isoform X2 n=1 Tax=Poeciliopsis prolifica TaxID=188132 RepID=UPI00241461E7|nr:kisspeptin 2 isoform X2 [Poeciliopsis prolifica]
MQPGCTLCFFAGGRKKMGGDEANNRTTLRRRRAGDFLAEDPNLCLSLRQDEEQQQLLCNDRRSKFNYNPFGLRFGKRYNNNYVFRRAVKRARTRGFLPLSLFSRELEVST